jgi:hypothetical protein
MTAVALSWKRDRWITSRFGGIATRSQADAVQRVDNLSWTNPLPPGSLLLTSLLALADPDLVP